MVFSPMYTTTTEDEKQLTGWLMNDEALRDGGSTMVSEKACENARCLLILHEMFGRRVSG